MKDLTARLGAAQESRFGLAHLNWVLRRGIPFNAPHGLVVKSVGREAIEIALPHRRKNLNHLGGLHACALAAAAEFASGLRLFAALEAAEYRVIMQKLAMEYFYQGRSAAVSRCHAGEGWISEAVKQPLESQDAVLVEMVSEVRDLEDQLLCRGEITWQVKRWGAVRSKGK